MHLAMTFADIHIRDKKDSFLDSKVDPVCGDSTC
jgi:hypothetical protein